MNAPKTDEWKKKASEAKMGSKNPMFGKPRSEEDKNKTRIAQLGELGNFYGKHHSSETKQLISIKMSGRQFSDEHREKLSISKKGKYIGENNPAYKFSAEIRLQVIKLLQEGLSSRKIQELLGVSKTTVLRIKKNGV